MNNHDFVFMSLQRYPSDALIVINGDSPCIQKWRNLCRRQLCEWKLHNLIFDINTQFELICTKRLCLPYSSFSVCKQFTMKCQSKCTKKKIQFLLFFNSTKRFYDVKWLFFIALVVKRYWHIKMTRQHLRISKKVFDFPTRICDLPSVLVHLLFTRNFE